MDQPRMQIYLTELAKSIVKTIGDIHLEVKKNNTVIPYFGQCSMFDVQGTRIEIF